MSVATVIAAIVCCWTSRSSLSRQWSFVGPEFGPLAALCVGLVQRKFTLVRRLAVALAVGFGVGVTVTAVWLLTATGLVNKSMLLSPRPLTDFIWRPDVLSWVIGSSAASPASGC
jgi:hypothetical protein